MSCDIFFIQIQMIRYSKYLVQIGINVLNLEYLKKLKIYIEKNQKSYELNFIVLLIYYN